MSDDPNLEVIEHKVPVIKRTAAQDEAEPKPKPFPPYRPSPSQGPEPSSAVEPKPFFSTLVEPVSSKVSEEEINKIPYSATGRLRFAWQGGSYLGTAWAGTPQGLITAAHNIYDVNEKKGQHWGEVLPEGWSSDLRFALCFDDGTFTAEVRLDKVFILSGWAKTGRTQYDLAACTWQGGVIFRAAPVAANVPVQMIGEYTSIGYPGEPALGYDFNGKEMWKSVGDFLQKDPGAYSVGSILTKGASGGPWWVKIGAQSYVNGLTSGGGEKDNWSPYFGDGFMKLFYKIA